MTNKIKIIICSVIAIFGLLAPLAIADNSMAATTGSKETYFDWECGGKPDKDVIPCVIKTIYNWLSIGVLVVVVIGIIVGAIQYTSAQGNQEQAKNGMKKIASAILALGLYAIMWAFINFLVPGGILQGLNDPEPGKPYDIYFKDSHYDRKV